MSPLEQPEHLVIAATVKLFRLEAGLTQEQVALGAGINASEISLLESGKRSPRWETMKRVAKGLGVPFWRMARVAEMLDQELAESAE
jgi:transcriptional regulator with XRE-family HTH domain